MDPECTDCGLRMPNPATGRCSDYLACRARQTGRRIVQGGHLACGEHNPPVLLNQLGWCTACRITVDFQSTVLVPFPSEVREAVAQETQLEETLGTVRFLDTCPFDDESFTRRNVLLKITRALETTFPDELQAIMQELERRMPADGFIPSSSRLEVDDAHYIWINDNAVRESLFTMKTHHIQRTLSNLEGRPLSETPRDARLRDLWIPRFKRELRWRGAPEKAQVTGVLTTSTTPIFEHCTCGHPTSLHMNGGIVTSGVRADPPPQRCIGWISDEYGRHHRCSCTDFTRPVHLRPPFTQIDGTQSQLFACGLAPMNLGEYEYVGAAILDTHQRPITCRGCADIISNARAQAERQR